MNTVVLEVRSLTESLGEVAQAMKAVRSDPQVDSVKVEFLLRAA